MSKFDKILHMVGLGAAGVLVTAISGGIALPLAVKLGLVAVAFGTGTVTNPMFGKSDKSDKPPSP